MELISGEKVIVGVKLDKGREVALELIVDRIGGRVETEDVPLLNSE